MLAAGGVRSRRDRCVFQTASPGAADDFLSACRDAAGLMEAAFAARAVDESVRGGWEDVMVDLSMIGERRTAPPPPWAGRTAVRDLPRPVSPSRPGRKADRKAKARRKAEKQARKRNRRK